MGVFSGCYIYFISVLILNTCEPNVARLTSNSIPIANRPIEGSTTKGSRAIRSRSTSNRSTTSLLYAFRQTEGRKCQMQNHSACGTGFTKLTNNKSNTFCLKFINERATWNQARISCRVSKNNSDLLVIRDDILEHMLKKYFVKVTKAWIGLARNTDGSFTWNQDSWPIGQPLGGYTNWAPGQPLDADGHCGVLTSDGWQLVDCGEQLPYVCMHEPEGDRARRIFKPTLSIKPEYSKPRHLWDGFFVHVTCTFIEDRFSNDAFHRIKIVSPHAQSERFRTRYSKFYDFQDLDFPDVCYFKQVRILYFIAGKAIDQATILCLSKRYKQTRCPSHQNDCTQAGPFKVVSSESMPILKGKVLGNERRSVYVGEDLTFTCKARVGANRKLEWRATVEGTPVEAKYVMILSDTKEGYSESTLKISPVRRHMNGLIVGCFSFHVNNNNSARLYCERGIYLCMESYLIKIRYGPKTPKLVVDYHKKPAVVYLGKSLTASCSANVGEGGYLNWVWYDNDNYTFPGINVKKYGIVLRQTQQTATTGVLTIQSYITIKEVNLDHDQMKIACFSLIESEEQVGGQCPMGSKYCVISRTLVVKDQGNETEAGGESDSDTYPTVITIVGLAYLAMTVIAYFICCRNSKPASEGENSFYEEMYRRRSESQFTTTETDISFLSAIGVITRGKEIGPSGKKRRFAETAV